MKKRYNLLFVLTILAILFIACNDENEPVKTPPQVEDSMHITASSDVVELTEGNQEDVLLTFDWNAGTGRGEDTYLTYLFKIDIADNNFESAKREELGENVLSRSFTGKELYKLAIEKWKVKPGDVAELDVKVIATVNNSPTLYMKPEISTTKIKVKTYKVAPTDMFLIGSANPAGANESKGILLTEEVSKKIYTWGGNLKVGEFKFIRSTTDLLPSLNKGADESQLVVRETESDPDDMFVVTTAGYHTIAIDMETMTIIHAYVPYKDVYVVGHATPAGWEPNGFMPLQYDMFQPNKFIYEGPITAGELKFPIEQKQWDSRMLMPLIPNAPIDGTSNQMQLNKSPVDMKWLVKESEAGNYRITVDPINLTVDFKKLD